METLSQGKKTAKVVVFKSYYVVWKLILVDEMVFSESGLNRTM